MSDALQNQSVAGEPQAILTFNQKDGTGVIKLNLTGGIKPENVVNGVLNLSLNAHPNNIVVKVIVKK